MILYINKILYIQIRFIYALYKLGTWNNLLKYTFFNVQNSQIDCSLALQMRSRGIKNILSSRSSEKNKCMEVLFKWNFFLTSSNDKGLLFIFVSKLWYLSKSKKENVWSHKNTFLNSNGKSPNQFNNKTLQIPSKQNFP